MPGELPIVVNLKIAVGTSGHIGRDGPLDEELYEVGGAEKFLREL